MRLLHCYLWLAALLFIPEAKAQTTNYQVYALFVINIAKYSSWPSLGNEFHITVVGKSKVYDELMKQAGKSINGHTLKVTLVDNMSEIGQPNIIYLADGKSSILEDILKATEGKAIMVIGEREGLYKKGAGFSFVIMENSTLRYDINNTALENRQIKVSKNLTALANAML